MATQSTIPIVLTGAMGRMGKTILSLLQADERFTVSALVVLPAEWEEARKLHGNIVFEKLQDALGVVMEKSDSGMVSRPVIIDFTSPQSSLAFAKTAAECGAAHVIGSTGFDEAQRAELAEYAAQTPILWSPNMSVGVNVLLDILPMLVQKLGPDYDMEVLEIHHKKKKDAPSGTAVRLGEVLAEARGWDYAKTACFHREGITGERPHEQIGMQTLRGGDVVGLHTVYFMGPGERIEVTHQAHSRENFANGALRAAAWLSGKKSGKLYAMKDVLAESQ